MIVFLHRMRTPDFVSHHLSIKRKDYDKQNQFLYSLFPTSVFLCKQTEPSISYTHLVYVNKYVHLMYYIPRGLGIRWHCTWKRADTVIPAQQSPMKRKPPIIRGLLPRRSIVKHWKTNDRQELLWLTAVMSHQQEVRNGWLFILWSHHPNSRWLNIWNILTTVISLRHRWCRIDFWLTYSEQVPVLTWNSATDSSTNRPFFTAGILTYCRKVQKSSVPSSVY